MLEPSLAAMFKVKVPAIATSLNEITPSLIWNRSWSSPPLIEKVTVSESTSVAVATYEVVNEPTEPDPVATEVKTDGEVSRYVAEVAEVERTVPDPGRLYLRTTEQVVEPVKSDPTST